MLRGKNVRIEGHFFHIQLTRKFVFILITFSNLMTAHTKHEAGKLT